MVELDWVHTSPNCAFKADFMKVQLVQPISHDLVIFLVIDHPVQTTNILELFGRMELNYQYLESKMAISIIVVCYLKCQDQLVNMGSPLGFGFVLSQVYQIW